MLTDTSIDLFSEIHKLKKEKNAIILAHYYQEPDIQDVADFIGDSLGLSQQAAKTKADIIVFAGVHFMAETAKILSPSKKVLLPDIICTSTNAQKIVETLPKDQKIIFAPDKNLGKYIQKKTGREMVLWDGSCMVHEIFSFKKIIRLKENNPKAKFIAHPECEEHILEIADYIGSTTGLLNYTIKNDSKEFIVATETGIIHQMQKASPHKTFIPAPPENSCACNDCPHMKLNTLEKLYNCLKYERPEITLDKDLIERAVVPIKRMLDISAQLGL